MEIDFWGWGAYRAQLRCPDDVSNDTGCVSESGDFKNVMNSKYFHLFCFNTYEHPVYINEFRYFQFQFSPFNNLTHWKQKSYFPKITSFRCPNLGTR
jgi:hypothetical protein